jgi:hypothetical protein
MDPFCYRRKREGHAQYQQIDNYTAAGATASGCSDLLRITGRPGHGRSEKKSTRRTCESLPINLCSVFSAHPTSPPLNSLLHVKHSNASTRADGSF